MDSRSAGGCICGSFKHLIEIAAAAAPSASLADDKVCGSENFRGSFAIDPGSDTMLDDEDVHRIPARHQGVEHKEPTGPAEEPATCYQAA